MIEIRLDSIGKKFESRWIFRRLSLEFKQGDSVVITGFNGSGKSTLLQIISGYQSPSEGKMHCSKDGTVIPIEDWYKEITCVTPLLELPEDLSFRENITFFKQFKPLQVDFSDEKLANLTQLNGFLDQPIRTFSSGMKQRVKLMLSLLSASPVVLLDEPLSNLDRPGIDWFTEQMHTFIKDRLLIICSNHQEEEMRLCKTHFDLSEFIAASK